MAAKASAASENSTSLGGKAKEKPQLVRKYIAVRALHQHFTLYQGVYYPHNQKSSHLTPIPAK
jgi:hypothetical protein